MKSALITGITGQDGSYLTEFLIAKGYEVHGVIRRASVFNTDRIDHLYQDPHAEGVVMRLHYGDLTDPTSMRRALEEVRPAEVYNLGAQSHVKVSFEQPLYTADTVALGSLGLLEAIRDYQHRNGGQQAFHRLLVGMYHHRVDYPGFDFGNRPKTETTSESADGTTG